MQVSSIKAESLEPEWVGDSLTNLQIHLTALVAEKKVNKHFGNISKEEFFNVQFPRTDGNQ